MTAIDDAVYQLRQHRGLTRVGEPIPVESGGTIIDIDVHVELPSRARVAGVSDNGVCSVERCTLVFPADWPQRAPRPYLRDTFPLDLPHINPHHPGGLVSPCVFEGSLDELLHRFGLDAIVDQIVDWLTKAAAGTLTDLAQGWESTRRDDCPSIVVFSAELLCEAAPTDGNVLTVRATYATKANGGVYSIVDASLAEDTTSTFYQELKGEGEDRWAFGSCAVFIAQAPANEGKVHIADRYTPETVVDLDSLVVRANEFGIDGARLAGHLEDYRKQCVIGSKQDPRAWSCGLYAIVVLLAHRPAPLITSRGRSVEVLPYVVRFEIDPRDVFAHKSTVHSAFHLHALSPQLLAQTSDHALAHTEKRIALLGCGSLGSKIGLHLARAGFGHMTLVDNDFISPHNLARHALMDIESALLFPKKAELMKQAVGKLSHTQARAFHVDAVSVLSDSARFGEVIDAQAALIIDATASLGVLAAASRSQLLTGSNARLVRAVLYGQGRCAALLLEAPGRAVRVDDLTALIFESCRHDEALRAAIAGESSEPTRIFVGDNCRSVTTPMSDAVISRSAASITIQLERWLNSEMPRTAVLATGAVDGTGIGLVWNVEAVSQVTAIDLVDDGGWQVRVLPDVAEAIDLDARKWGRLETGGALIGSFSLESRTITIAGLIDAPADSKRSGNRFTLGTEGLTAALRAAHESSLGHLSFVGTWHSHPMGGPHSRLDRETLTRIAGEARGRPAVSLVWTPTGLRCAVDRL